MKDNEIIHITNILINLEKATEKLIDLNNHISPPTDSYENKQLHDAMTLIKDAKTIAYEIVKEK